VDSRLVGGDDGGVNISPLPRHGDVVVGRDVAGRTLRISGHPQSGRVVLSIWQDTVCKATVRLLVEDVPAVVEMLARSALTPASSGEDARTLGTAG
jgi:hypothetical protein